MSDIIQRLRDAYAENPASALNLLPELFQEAEEGKIVELPCAVGNIVYTTYISSSGLTREVLPFPFHLENLEDIGKTVFLTRESAEKALREREL